MLSVFYQSVVRIALFFAAVCRRCSIKATDASRIDKLLEKVGYVMGASLDPVAMVAERRLLA